MQRVSNQSKVTESGRERLSSVRVTIPAKVAEQINHLSEHARIPSEIVAAEAMARGFALLKS